MLTEFPFTLRAGYVDAEGTIHRDGAMRRATAGDEILPLHDHRVQANPSYLTIIVLSRVVTRLGTLPEVTPAVIEALFAADFAFLQDLYVRVNQGESSEYPQLQHGFGVETGPSGE